ncbi:MAG: bis-aminopropyl spermidine synthase family protein [Chloroflexota bacterium]|nr:bis-aminopropyl spermidine synthase family protein [Dehalococcoidia bacterium]MDW8252261.1 bis-aminopropyl spermidine synthase family protein [Chloroflexota bacterium]
MYARLAALVSERTAIPTTERDIERILAALPAAADIWQAVDLAKCPFNQVVETVRVLAADGLADVGETSIALTERGRALAAERNAVPPPSLRCAACAGRGVSDEQLAEARRRFDAIAEGRPRPIAVYDQAYVTTDTVFARLAAFADRGDLAGRDLIVLGDDDLIGIAAALTGLPNRVVVVEIDERLNEFIRQVAAAERLALDVLTVDLRDPLPSSLAGAFHTFFTDPPDTLAGLELFIGRGLESLRGAGCAGYFGMTVIESSFRNWRALQARLTGYYRVAITDIVRDFSTYENWDYLVGSVRDDLPPLRRPPLTHWYRSSLYRIETFEDSVLAAAPVDEATLYVGAESLLHTKRDSDVASS